MREHDGIGIAIAALLAGFLVSAHKAPTPPAPTPYRPANPFRGMPDTQVIPRMAREMGVAVPAYSYDCRHIDGAGRLNEGYAGLADYAQNLLVICPDATQTEARRHYTIAHELAHFRHHQQRRRTTEQQADRDAIDYLVRAGHWDAVRAKASWGAVGADYEPGTRYAQQAIAQRQP